VSDEDGGREAKQGGWVVGFVGVAVVLLVTSPIENDVVHFGVVMVLSVAIGLVMRAVQNRR
jgi:hypothetical protein